jgi:hypothetical protein
MAGPDDFFTSSRPRAPAGAGGGGSVGHGPGGGASPRTARSPLLGIAALVLVVAGLWVTLFGGNQGGLLGVPAALLGLVLGAVAWGGGYGAVWGRAAVLGVLGSVGLAVLLELVRL